MISKALELLTGKDDLERVADKGNLAQLNTYLETRPVWVPKRPIRFLDAASFTQDDLLNLIREEAQATSQNDLDLWVMDFDGKNRLPAFSSLKKAKVFNAAISKELDKVFSLGCIKILIKDLPKEPLIDFIDLNRFSKKHWTIGMTS